MSPLQRMSVCTAAVLVLGGCAVDDHESGAQFRESVEAAQQAESEAPPQYTESEACREEMQPILDTMLRSDSDGLDLQVFSERTTRLSDQFDDDDDECSNAVTQPARGAMYEFAMANVWHTLCSNSSTCDFDQTLSKIEKSVDRGVLRANRAQDALDAQS